MDDLDFGATIKGFSPGQKVFNRYKLERILGRGGMGVVWLARDGELEREVALKFLPEIVALDPEAVGDLKRETRRNLDLTHIHIVRIYDFVTDARTAAISMEYVDGATLSARKIEKPERALSVEELKPWLEQLCAALHYAHAKAKVVHRDLKPANLMVNRHGDLKITDFGIARGISDSVTRVSKQAGSSGTPVYMSPQQMMGEDPAVADDIYALGATLFELLAGKPPFHTGNIILQVQNKPAPLVNERRATQGLPAVPPEWEQTIAACLAKEPAGRPASAAELWRRLEGGAVAASPPPVAAPAPVVPVVSEKKPESTPAPTPVGPPFFPALATVLAGVTVLPVAGGVMWLALKNPDDWKYVVYTAWMLWSFLAAVVCVGLPSAGFPSRRVLGIGVLLAGSAVLAQEIGSWVFSAEDYVEQRGFYVFALFNLLGTVGGGVLAAMKSGASQRERGLLVFAGLGAGLLGGCASWLPPELGWLPGDFHSRIQPGLTVVLGAIAALASWTVADRRPPAENRDRLLCGAFAVLAALVGTSVLLAFWHRGAVYNEGKMEWTTITHVVESTVWLGWCAVSFGLIASQATVRAGRLAALLTGVVFAACGLLFREYWMEVEKFVLQMPTDTFFSVASGYYATSTELPTPGSSILLGVGLMMGGLVMRWPTGRPTVRQGLLHLAGGVAAGLAGYGAAQLPWTPVSWEGLSCYQIWYALAGTGLIAYLLLLLPPLTTGGNTSTAKITTPHV